MSHNPRDARQEKLRMINKLINFLKERKFHANVSPNELTQPSQQTFLAVWQFLLRQLDVSISIPSTSYEDLIIQVFEQLGYKDKISKSVLRSFNSPPSWLQTLGLLCYLIDASYMEERLLLPMLIPPGEHCGVIDPPILSRLVKAARFSDPQNQTDWASHFSRLKSFAYHWEIYVLGEIDEEELIRKQIGWASALAHQDDLDCESIDAAIAAEDAQRRSLEQMHSSIAETTDLAVKYRKDLNDLKLNLEKKTMAETMKQSDQPSLMSQISTLETEISAYTKERKELEDIIELQECDREQVNSFQSEIETLRDSLREVRQERAAIAAAIAGLKTNTKSFMDLVRHRTDKLTLVLRNEVLPKIKAEDPLNHKLWHRLFLSASVSENAVFALIKSELSENKAIDTDASSFIDALVNIPISQLIDQLVAKKAEDTSFQRELELDYEALTKDLEETKQAASQLDQTLDALRLDDKNTRMVYDEAQQDLKSGNEKLQQSIKLINSQLEELDPSLSKEMSEIEYGISIIESAAAEECKSHQHEMKKYTDLLNVMEYKWDRRSLRTINSWRQTNEALKELLYNPVQNGLCDPNSDVYKQVFYAVKKEATDVLRAYDVLLQN